jgi:hypothetical protein
MLPAYQEGYIAMVVGQVANRGNAKAKTVLNWMSNFILGLHTPGNGFCPYQGLYEITQYASGGGYLQTWAALKTANFGSGACPGASTDEFMFPVTAAMGPMVDLGIANAATVRNNMLTRDAMWSPNVNPSVYSKRANANANFAIAPLQ